MQLEVLRVVLGALMLSFAPAAPAQDVNAKEPEPPAAAQDPTADAFAALGLEPGPTTGTLGSNARIAVPAGMSFTGRAGTRKFLELTHNPPSGAEVGTVLSEDGTWFVVFEYEDSGHVKDEDKDELDADDLLDTLKEGTAAGNEVRKQRGWAPIELVGWHKPPFYDPATHNLTWSTIARGQNGESINWSTRLLGRTGTMNVDLVSDKESIDAVLPAFTELMAGFEYVEGQRYAEFKAGDKVAKYGLAALVAGGAGVLAAKTGLFAKFWKLIVIGAVAVGAFFKKLFGFGKKTTPGEGTA